MVIMIPFPPGYQEVSSAVSGWYCTRENVKQGLDIKETALASQQIDRLIESASRAIEGFLHRKFVPTLATKSFAWPSNQMGTSYRLWLDENELIGLSAITSGGVTLETDDVFLEPQSLGPPYTHIEMDLAGRGSFATGSTAQRNIQVSGLFGFTDDQVNAGQLASGMNTSQTTMTVTDASLIGVGDILRVENERIPVIERGMVSTTVTLSANIDKLNSTTLIPVSDGTKLHVGEMILVDAESMLITNIAGNNLVVRRAKDGSAIADHTSGATVYAPRLLTVVRGTYGTDAATHAMSVPVTRWEVPGPVRQLCIAEVMVALQNEGASYAVISGSGDRSKQTATWASVEALRSRAMAFCGRIRMGAV